MRAVVADDDYLLREGLVRLLAEQGIEVVAQAGDADELLRRVAGHKPDVAVIDIRMPPTNTDDGLRAAITIRERAPGTGVLLLSQYVITERAVQKHVSSIFLKLGLPQAPEDHRRVLAVLLQLGAVSGPRSRP